LEDTAARGPSVGKGECENAKGRKEKNNRMPHRSVRPGLQSKSEVLDQGRQRVNQVLTATHEPVKSWAGGCGGGGGLLKLCRKGNP